MERQAAFIGQDAAPNRGLAVIPVSLAAASAALFLLVWLSEEVLHSKTERFDQAVRALVHAHATIWSADEDVRRSIEAADKSFTAKVAKDGAKDGKGAAGSGDHSDADAASRVSTTFRSTKRLKRSR